MKSYTKSATSNEPMPPEEFAEDPLYTIKEELSEMEQSANLRTASNNPH